MAYSSNHSMSCCPPLISLALQTSAWSNQKTASRLCKARLLLHYLHLTARVTQLRVPQCKPLLVEQQQLMTVSPKSPDAFSTTTAVMAADTMRLAKASKSYLQCKQGSQKYATQWRDLQMQKPFASWTPKPSHLELFSL